LKVLSLWIKSLSVTIPVTPRLFTIYTGKPVGLLFGSVWANGKQISVLGKFRSGLALTICRNPYHLQKSLPFAEIPTIYQKICATAMANEKVAKL